MSKNVEILHTHTHTHTGILVKDIKSNFKYIIRQKYL